MKCYIISFEVATQTTRNALKEHIKAYSSNYCPINEQCWAILSDHSAVQVRDYLTQFISQTDRLFVVRSGTEAAWRNAYGGKHSDWLKKYL